jgi:hypothetical protein
MQDMAHFPLIILRHMINNCMMTSFTKYSQSDQIKRRAIGGHVTRMTEEKCVESGRGKPWQED